MSGPRKDDRGVLLAMVLLNAPAFPDPERLMELLQRRFGPGKVRWGDGAQPDAGGPAVRALSIGDDVVTVALMPAPIPWGDLEGPCATARFWPEAASVCRAHRAHLVVVLQGSGKDALDQHLTLTHAISAIVQAAGAPAVYWGNGTVVHCGEQFVRFAEDANRSGFPVHLWVDIRVFQRDQDRLFVATTGLHAFGLMEIEAESRNRAPRELFEKVFDLSHYLISNGPVIRDGDTVGEDERERIVARYRRSVWDREGQVIRLEIDGPESRSGFGAIIDFFTKKR